MWQTQLGEDERVIDTVVELIEQRSSGDKEVIVSG